MLYFYPSFLSCLQIERLWNERCGGWVTEVKDEAHLMAQGLTSPILILV